MLAIAAAGAFVGLFALWVILPRKFLRDKQGKQSRGAATLLTAQQDQDSPENSTPLVLQAAPDRRKPAHPRCNKHLTST